VKWAATLAEAGRLEDAFEEAAEAIADDLDGARADLLFAFASGEYAGHYARLHACVREAFPGATLVGCSAGGVIGGPVEVERRPALALAAASLPGVRLTPFHVAVDDAADRLASAIRGQPNLVLLPDPFSFRVEEALRGLDVACPGAVVVGGLASGASFPGGNALFMGDAIYEEGAVGVALDGNLEVETVVAQGCRPIGTPLFATRAEGNLIHALDGTPAVEVLEALYAELPARDQALFRTSLFIGVVMDERREVYRQGDFLVRNLVGIDARTGALAVSARIRPNAVVQFQLRDAATSAADLEALLTARDGDPPAGALLFSCMGRGEGLYGRPSHDAEMFAERVGAIPLAGFFCNGEIGPVGGRTHLHGYTSSFALFRPRRDA
jgi:small ligand-binding sensory domain FIST